MCHRVTLLMYKRLSIYKACISTIDVWPWWDFIHFSCPVRQRSGYTVMKLLMGETCLASDRNRIERNGVICKFCDSGQPENVPHLLFECNFFHERRQTEWQKVIEAAPPPMMEGVTRMLPGERTQFLFSGFRCRYTPEWDELYCAVMDFIVHMYKLRRRYEENAA